MGTKQIISKNISADSTQYIGRDGELWIDTVTNKMKISDGATPGGVDIVNAGGGGGATTWALLGDKNTANGPVTIALGANAGETAQGTAGVAIGNEAGKTTQSTLAVAVGQYAGFDTQGTAGVAIGNLAGRASQGVQAVAVGQNAGNTSQGAQSIAIGEKAGQTTQGDVAVAIGTQAGMTTQGLRAIAIGLQAAEITQANDAVAIGNGAGYNNQGLSAIAIGAVAGNVNQAARSIVISAAGVAVNNTTADSLVITPIRSAVGTTMLMYDATSGEVTHTASPLITGDLAVEENYSQTPTIKYFEVETGAGNNRIMRSGINMSGFGQSVAPTIDLTSYRVSPADGDAGPELMFRASTAGSSGSVIARIETKVIATASGAETTEVSIHTDNAGTSVTPFKITGNTVYSASHISLADLKTEVAASADFAAFKARIAAL